MFNLTHLLVTASYAGIFGMVFAETGLLLGFFLPGDSLLITAGLLASGHKLLLWAVILAAFLGSVIGDSAGYLIGRRLGPAVFNRPNHRFFKPEYVTQARGYFGRYGGRALVIARFVPVIRTVVPTMAGVSGMHYPHFLFYNVIGGALWSAGVPLLAYFLGQLIPNLDHYILLAIAVVVVVSLIPVVLEWRRSRVRA